ncbi:MAG: BatD family protein [Phycisphaerales bacterium]
MKRPLTMSARGLGHAAAALLSAAVVLAAALTPLVVIPAALAQAASNEPLTAEARVSDASVYEGQRFRLQVWVEGSDAPEQPDTTGLADFDVSFAGGGTNNRSSVVIINGKMQQDDSRGFVFNYDLVPKRAGVLTIPAITIREGKRQAATQALAIRVNPPGENDRVRVQFTLDPVNPYIGEPTTLRVKLLLNSHVRDLSFSFRGLEDGFTVPQGREINQPMRQQGIELLGEIVPWTQAEEVIDGASVTTYSAERVVIPKRAGTGEVALTMSGSMVTSPGDGFFTRERTAPIAVKGNTVKVNVRELPTQGKTANFNNLVGRFTVSVSADPIAVNVGDPISLKVTVNGSGPMDRVPRPDLRRVLGDRFRVPDDMATPELRTGQVVFTQTVRPTSADVKEIPSIEFPFFDTQSGTYSVARSSPIPLRVASTRVITSGDAVAAEPDAVSAPDLREREGGISANIDATTILADQRFDLAREVSSPGLLAVAGGPAAAYGAAALVLAVRRRGMKNPSASRRRGAHAAALAALREADGPDAHARIARALTGYVADRFDLPAGGLTAQEAEERLRPVDADGAAQFRAVLERCDAARFAGLGAGELGELREAALKALDRVNGTAKNGGGR